MYIVKTKFGIQFNYIHSWSEWSINKDFICFLQGKRLNPSIKKELILQIKDIEYIEEEY